MISNGIDVSKEIFELWYSILASYIKQKPNNDSISTFLSKYSNIVSTAKDVIEIVDKLRKNDKVIELLKKVSEEII